MAHALRELSKKHVTLRITSEFRLPELPGHILPRRVFTSTYFDTNGYSLGRLGITLRRKVEQKKGVWQLQLPSPSGRLELDRAGGPNTLPPEFRDLLFAFIQEADPQPLKKLRTERQRFQVARHDKVLAEINHDAVALIEKERIRHRLFELEIELIDGSKKDLRHITQALLKAGALKEDSYPKIFQGVSVAFPEALQHVDASAPPREHLHSHLQRQVAEILTHDPGTRFGKDPEDLHHMRVATRRLRALLRIGRDFMDPEWTKSLLKEVGWLGKVLGMVRDSDVLIKGLRHEASTLSSPDQKIFQKLLAALETQRSISRGMMLDALRSPRYPELLNKLQHAIRHPQAVSTNLSLQQIGARQFKKLYSHVENLKVNFSDDNLHRTRIRVKRVRYAAELAEKTVGGSASRFIREIKKVQDLLGSHHDAVLTEHRLQKLLRSSRSTKAAFAVGQIVERLRARRKTIRETIPKRWRKLKKRGKEVWG